MPDTLITDEEDWYWERVQNYFLEVEVPIRKIDRALSFGAGLGFRRYSEAQADDPLEQNPFFEGELGYLSFGIRYSDVQGYPRSISFEEGVSVEVGLQSYTRKLSSDLSFRLAQLSIDKYLRVPGTRHHVLYTRLLAEVTNLQDLDSDIDLLSKSFRGFKETNWRKKTYGGSIEYRLPLLDIQRGHATWPIYLRQLHCSLFTDYWRYFDKTKVRKELAASGMELSLDLGVIYRIPLSLTFGYAQPWKGEKDTFSAGAYWRVNLGLGIEAESRTDVSFGKLPSGREL